MKPSRVYQRPTRIILNRSSDTLTTPGAAAVFHLAWPMILKAVFLHGTVVVDGLLVAPLGEIAIAAMGVAAAVGGIVLGFIFAFSHAMQIRSAQAFGADNGVFQKSVLFTGTTIGMFLGLMGVILIAIFGKFAIASLASNEHVAAEAWAYLSIFTIFILGQSVSQPVVSYFNGCGRAKIPLIGYCISVPINIVSSYALIFGVWGAPELGVAGAALGSALAIIAQTIYLMVQLVRIEGHLRTVVGWHNGTFLQTLTNLTTFSIPIGATFVSANLASHVCVLLYAKMTLPAFAALTLIVPWNMLAGQISMQWTQATGIIVAQLLGNRTKATVLASFLNMAWRYAFVAAGIVSAIFLVMCLSVDEIYPKLEAETRAIIFGFLPLLILSQPLRATNAICGNVLRASGDTIYVMHIFIWSQWAFRVPLTALFVLYWDLSAFWVLSLWLAEEVVKFPAFHWRLLQGHWKHAVVD